MDFFRGWHGHATYPATALVAVGGGRVGAGGCGRGEVRLVSTRWSVFVLVQPLLCGWGVRLARDASSSSQASTGQWMNRARRSAASRVNSPNGCRSSLESRDVVRAVRLFGSYCQALTSCVTGRVSDEKSGRLCSCTTSWHLVHSPLLYRPVL